MLAIATLCLVGCNRHVASESYTETKVKWQGATAEDIRDVIRSIAPGIHGAVIEDGEAVLYHRGTVEETQKELDGSVGMRPVELTISAPIAKEGKIPEAPSPVERVQIRWEVDRAKAASHGISVAEIASRLHEFDLAQDKVAAAKALHDKTIKTPSGAEVSFESLVDAKATTVSRPLILNE
jgi:hypothetical protein